MSNQIHQDGTFLAEAETATRPVRITYMYNTGLYILYILYVQYIASTQYIRLYRCPLRPQVLLHGLTPAPVNMYVYTM